MFDNFRSQERGSSASPLFSLERRTCVTCKSEITKFGFTVFKNEDIFKLDIIVNNVLAVKILNSLGNTREDLSGFGRVKRVGVIVLQVGE